MKLKILCPQWGMEKLDLEDFLHTIKSAGYDGIDTWVPNERTERNRMRRLLDEYELVMVSHQHQAAGNNINEFCQSFDYYLHLAAEVDPVLINSHSGRDWFTLEENLKVLDTAAKFENNNKIVVAHETHRGRLGFCPGHAQQLFDLRKEMKITADLSHWVCVSESYLEHFEETLQEAIRRTAHVHARVGFPEGPQVPDPRLPQWAEALKHFSGWWSRIIEGKRSSHAEYLTITTEFGPPPYMWTDQSTNKPLASQWEVNVFVKELLRKISGI